MRLLLKLTQFLFQVKEIEKRDSVLTPKQQIERLLRPGSTYFNLNPFEVLQVEPDASLDEIKKKYRRLSILVHPDKNMVCIYFKKFYKSKKQNKHCFLNLDIF